LAPVVNHRFATNELDDGGIAGCVLDGEMDVGLVTVGFDHHNLNAFKEF